MKRACSVGLVVSLCTILYSMEEKKEQKVQSNGISSRPILYRLRAVRRSFSEELWFKARRVVRDHKRQDSDPLPQESHNKMKDLIGVANNIGLPKRLIKTMEKSVSPKAQERKQGFDEILTTMPGDQDFN